MRRPAHPISWSLWDFFGAHLKFTKFNVECVISARVAGAAHSQFLNKRKLKQAQNLPLDAVKRLEEERISGDSMVHSVVAGALLFCIFARARWSAISRIENCTILEHEGVVLIEAETAKHKTSRTKEAQTRMLSYTAIGKFCGEESWAKKFLHAREKSGLSREDLLIPSFDDRFSKWTQAPMSSAEATCFLRDTGKARWRRQGVKIFIPFAQGYNFSLGITWPTELQSRRPDFAPAQGCSAQCGG